VLFIIIARDLMIVAAAVGYFLGEMTSESDLLEPSLISKINTVLQILLVVYLILAQFYPELKIWFEMAFIIVATSTTLSGADYTWLWIRRFIFQETKK
jgi:cardiolipin synthase